jgi:hypothetical protein
VTAAQLEAWLAERIAGWNALGAALCGAFLRVGG